MQDITHETHTGLAETIPVGKQFRTSHEVESVIQTSRTMPFMQKYFHEQTEDKITDRKNSGATFCGCTAYENDYTGACTFLIGEEVTSAGALPDLEALIIPPQKYVKFTASPGSMPEAVIDTWQKNWQMTDAGLGGRRRYHTDFDVYGQRAANPKNTIPDIYRNNLPTTLLS